MGSSFSMMLLRTTSVSSLGFWRRSKQKSVTFLGVEIMPDRLKEITVIQDSLQFLKKEKKEKEKSLLELKKEITTLKRKINSIEQHVANEEAASKYTVGEWFASPKNNHIFYIEKVSLKSFITYIMINTEIFHVYRHCRAARLLIKESARKISSHEALVILPEALEIIQEAKEMENLFHYWEDFSLIKHCDATFQQ